MLALQYSALRGRGFGGQFSEGECTIACPAVPQVELGSGWASVTRDQQTLRTRSSPAPRLIAEGPNTNQQTQTDTIFSATHLLAFQPQRALQPLL